MGVVMNGWGNGLPVRQLPTVHARFPKLAVWLASPTMHASSTRSLPMVARRTLCTLSWSAWAGAAAPRSTR